MIFKNISKLRTPSERALFNELVSLYSKIVREMSARGGKTFQVESFKIVSPEVIAELTAMGVISNEGEIVALEDELKDLYSVFLSAVNCYLSDKRLFGSTLEKLNNTKRKEVQTIQEKANKPTIVDLFAGGGGLSLGFTQAGYKVLLANDLEEVCINTYRYNHPEVPPERVVQDDIRIIVDNITDFVPEDVDVVIGGPPCQGFSSANQQRIIDDPRNELYKYFIKAVAQIAPKFVVMENVRGMLSVADQVVEDYKNIKAVKRGKEYSYEIAYEMLNSANFSVAQSRERLIFIAVRSDLVREKNISPAFVFHEIKQGCDKNKRFNLSDALSFIPPLKAQRVKNRNEFDDDETGKKVANNSFTGAENEYLKLINHGRTIPLVFNHKARYVNDTNYEIYRLLQPGEDASDEKIAHIMPYKHRLHCFKDKYYKLVPDKPCRTITAHLRMDCHSHIHPFQVRAITPREAARCQSFPDDYLFLGAYLKTYMIIGNAVPVLMSNAIAKTIKNHL